MIAKIFSRVLVALIVCVWGCLPAQADIKVISKDTEARIAKESPGQWSFRTEGTRYVLESDTEGILAFKKEDKILARGKPKGEKLTLTTDGSTVYAYFKFSVDKIKMSPDGSSSLWEFKIKPDKIKVSYGGVEYGKVKFYKDSWKVKAKNRQGNTEAEFKGMDALSAAPGAYLASSLDRDKRICVVLTLLMMGR